MNNNYYSKDAYSLNFRAILLKCLLMMKLMAILLTTLLSFSYGSTIAQINIKEKSITLENTLNRINKITGMEFIYENDLLSDKKISVELSNETLEGSLSKLLSGQGLRYSIYGSTVVIMPKALTTTTALSAEVDQPGIYKGKVVDSVSRKGVSGVTFLIQSNKMGSISDDNGNFTLRFPSRSDIVTITCVGYKTKVMSIAQIIQNPYLVLSKREFKIEEAVVEHRNPKNVELDLSRRRHLSLSQVLDGSVPGVLIKPVVRTRQELTISGRGSGGIFANERENYEYLKRTNHPSVREFPTYEDYERKLMNDWSGITNGRGQTISANKSTTLDGIEIESRGGSVFPGSTKGMLIMIDGFPQKDFPANMPMSNVESIEVIRDPEECVKYGPQGINGVVIIKTMTGKSGKPEINYSTNIYLSGRPDNSLKALDLANTSDLLDFYQEQYQKNILPFVFYNIPDTRVPYAYNLLYDKLVKNISEDTFNSRWDSLRSIDNRSQLRELQQGRFMQQHNLAVSGAIPALKYNINALYTGQRQETRGSKNTNLDLNTNNQFRLFDNKVEGQVFFRFKTGAFKTPKSGANNLPPYQLLFDQNGDYIYDYSDTYRTALNTQYLASGLQDHGRNLLEDQLLNFNESKRKEISGFAKLNYRITDNLTWINSFLYQNTHNESLDFTDINSSDGRRNYNKYSILNRDKTMTYWLPFANYGLIGGSKNETLDARTGLAFEKKINDDHSIEAGASIWTSSERYDQDPSRRLYGIDSKGNGGDTLTLANATGNNLYQEYMSTSSLNMIFQPMNQQNRNLKIGGNLGYLYKDFLSTKFNYNGAFMPNYGRDPNYAGFHDAFIETDWDLHKHFNLSNRILSQLVIRNKTGLLRSSELPAQQSTNRELLSDWELYNIQLINYIRTNMSDINLNYTKNTLYLGLLDGDLTVAAGAYVSNENKVRWSGDVSFDVKRHFFFTSNFFSSFKLNYSLQNFDSYQNLMMQLSLNQLLPISPVQPNFLTFDQLPPAITNHDISMHLGLLKERLHFDLRYYDRNTSGLVIDAFNRPDPATGMNNRYVMNTMKSKGFELMGTMKLIRKKNFAWEMNVIAAHNTLTNVEVPELAYLPDMTYLTAQRNGYSTNALWSYNWGGLDEKGDPTIINGNGEKVKAAEESALIYSGVTIPPHTGSFTQTFDIHNFFIRTRLNWQGGAVARKYKPAPSGEYEYNADIANRWKEAGDEAKTDIPVIRQYDYNRLLITQNSTNSILSTNAIRLEEVQVGFFFPNKTLEAMKLKQLSLSVQANNVWFKAKNKYGYDPRSMSTTGLLMPRMPMEFSFTLNAVL